MNASWDGQVVVQVLEALEDQVAGMASTLDRHSGSIDPATVTVVAQAFSEFGKILTELSAWTESALTDADAPDEGRVALAHVVAGRFVSLRDSFHRLCTALQMNAAWPPPLPS